MKRKFVNTINLNNFKIETDTGFEKLSSISKTIPYKIFEINFANGNIIKCADDHIFINSEYKEVFAKDSLNHKIITKNSEHSEVVFIKETEVSENLYDVSVNSENHVYFSNNVLSHNSTTMAAFCTWSVIFNSEYKIAILANKEKVAKEILSRVKLMYEHLPKFLQQGVKSWNKTSIELENNSEIMAASTSSDAIRGFSVNALILDEFAVVKRTIADEFFTSVYPTISSGKKSKTIITSTPKGYNHFYKLWQDAQTNKNTFNPIYVNWSDVPGRDEEWKQKQIQDLGSEEKFAQEFCGEFLGSTKTLLPAFVLRSLASKSPIYSSEDLDIYKEPSDGREYILSVDTARGLQGDYSAFTIIDITEYPFEVVGKYKNSEISPMRYPSIIKSVAQKYNNAHCLIEINDNGQQVADILFYDLEYEYVIYLSNADRHIGVRTTKSTKRTGCTNLKQLMVDNKLLVFDSDIIFELSGFIQKGTSYEAEAGQHDDLVMTLVMFAWYVTTDHFNNLYDLDFRANMRKNIEKEISESVMPFGFIEDSVSKESESFLHEEPSGEKLIFEKVSEF